MTLNPQFLADKAGQRLDRYGNPIQERVSVNDKVPHRITFKDEVYRGQPVDDVFLVESYKPYNLPMYMSDLNDYD
jgi:hypothetical protein